MTVRRPSFLLITTDQQRADHLSCYGSQVLQTPHIDSLALRGTRFENAYVASPVCMPNRASLATGRMPSVHGVRHNGLNLDLGTTTFADVLRDAGWRTSLSGKPHFQCVTQAPAPMMKGLASAVTHRAHRQTPGRYDQEVGNLWRNGKNRNVDLPYYGFDSIDLAVGHGDQVDGHYTGWLLDRGINPAAVLGPQNALECNERQTLQAWRTAIPEELYPTSYIKTKTLERLQAHAGANKPFFHWASFCDPHHPFTPPGRYWNRYNPKEVELPASFFNKDRSELLENLYSLRRQNLANENGTGAIAVDEAELRVALALTYGMIAMVDDAVGDILAELARLDLAENTIVIFMSDHGDLMGDHGLIFKGPYHYRGLIRVPLIWTDPVHAQGKVNSAPVSTIDLAATILETAGTPPHQGLQGMPFVKIDGSEPESTDKRSEILIEDEVQSCVAGHDVRGRLRTLIQDGWRLTVYDGLDKGELYNITTDPDEFNNLWNDPGAAPRRAELTEMLLRQMIKHTETSPLPDYAA